MVIGFRLGASRAQRQPRGGLDVLGSGGIGLGLLDRLIEQLAYRVDRARREMIRIALKCFFTSRHGVVRQAQCLGGVKVPAVLEQITHLDQIDG